MKGYKVFEPDWTCNGFQYAVGETFEENVIPSCYYRGFHFCTQLKECFNYYPFNPNNKIAEIEALGEIDSESEKTKHCTNKIRIVREISWEEALKRVNTGISNTGLCNSGNYNAGNRNTGNYNEGYCNSGDWNSGHCNTGNRNSGWHNAGSYNSGNENSGHYNTGRHNSGSWNTGNYNSGDHNTGNWNTGNYNTGNYNSGDWNDSDFASGCFNTTESKIFMFNKPSDWSYSDWWNSEARYLLNKIQHNILKWIRSEDMTDEEKEHHPEHKTTGGYMKKLDRSERGQIWWNSLSDNEKDIIKSLPNFDPKIFEQCTGIKIE